MSKPVKKPVKRYIVTKRDEAFKSCVSTIFLDGDKNDIKILGKDTASYVTKTKPEFYLATTLKKLHSDVYVTEVEQIWLVLVDISKNTILQWIKKVKLDYDKN
jgi:hypothetical protein